MMRIIEAKEEADEESLAKRRKPNENNVEGAYIAALRGSKSRLWQQINPLNTEHKAIRQIKVGVGSESVVQEKSCPCGSGACLVLTANTDRNRGRMFYKCPLRQENGSCSFFMWCDTVSQTNSMATKVTSCGFFKSCNDQNVSADLAVSASTVYSNVTDPSNKTYNIRSGSPCFKCGQDGHWARDCHVPSSDSSAAFGGKSVKCGSCYKCGKPGHWARDCTSNQHMNAGKSSRSMSNLASY